MELDKIYLGDAYELIKGIPDKSIDCIITDPPYEFSGNKKWFGKAEKYMNGNARGVADLVNDENLTQGVRTEMLDEWCRVMKQINIFIFCNKWQMFDYLKYFQKDRGCNFEILVWAKTNPMPLANNNYIHDKEFCLNFWEKGAKRGKCTGFDLLKTVYSLPINQKDKKEFEHQTCKPLAMVENLVEIGTQEGGVILDTFMGSGTTAVACVNKNRHYLGFEVSERWYGVINDRLKGISQYDKRDNQGYSQTFLF